MYSNIDWKKVLYIMLALGLVSSLAGAIDIGNLVLTLPGLILGLTVHEFSHARMANRLGDPTPDNQGRLTLNPLAHIDPIGIILLIFAHIGWGKPVEVNYNNLTTNKSRGYCEAMISLAGPLSNFILAIILTLIYYALGIFAIPFISTSIGSILFTIIGSAITVNIGLGVFNLIPLPPLDGEKIFRNIMPYGVKEWLTKNTNTLQFAFMILWITGLLGTIVSPVIEVIFYIINGIVSFIFGIFI